MYTVYIHTQRDVMSVYIIYLYTYTHKVRIYMYMWRHYPLSTIMYLRRHFQGNDRATEESRRNLHNFRLRTRGERLYKRAPVSNYRRSLPLCVRTCTGMCVINTLRGVLLEIRTGQAYEYAHVRKKYPQI